MKIAILNLTKLGFSNLNNKPAILKTNNEVHQRYPGSDEVSLNAHYLV